MAWLTLDFESNSAVDLKKAGADRYWEDPTTEVLVLSGKHSDGRRFRWTPGQPIPPLFTEAYESGATFIAHSARFEKAAWRHAMVPLYDWPPLPNDRWHDTQARMANLAMPLDLDSGLKVLGLPFEKDKEGNKLTIGLSKINKRTGAMPVITPAIRERVGEYCDHDVDDQDGLHRRIGWLSPGERKIWLLNQRINDRGVGLDLPLIRAMQDVVDKASGPLAAEFAKLTGGLKMTQRDKVMSWMMDRGVMMPNMTKETLAAVLGDDQEDDDYEPELEGLDLDLPGDVRRALEIRQLIGSSSIKKLPTMEACVMLDGRARGLLQYHGTGPGRNSGRLLQPHNFPRGTIKGAVDAKVAALMSRDLDRIQAEFGPPVETVVSSLRHTLVSGPGRVYVSGDYSGIQARTVLAVAGQHDKTALMAAGADIYLDMAMQIYKRDLDKHENPAERQVGKNSVLGLGFQMAAPKFLLKYAKDMPGGASLEFAEEVVRVYREEWAPGVPKLWRALQDAALRAVQTGQPQEAYGLTYFMRDRWLVARRPSGVEMSYFNPTLGRHLMPWSTPDKPDVRDGWTYQAKKMGVWRTIKAFGGQLTENYVMGIERDIMTHGMEMAEKYGFPMVLEVHDEGLSEPLSANADEKAYAQILTEVEPWVKTMGIPVAVETWMGDRYRK